MDNCITGHRIGWRQLRVNEESITCSDIRDVWSMSRNILEKEWDKTKFKSWKSLETAGAICNNEELYFENSFLWLRQRYVGSKVVRNVLECQESAIYCKGSVMNKDGNKTCQGCSWAAETVDDTINNSSYWLESLCMDCHNSICRNVCYVFCCKF